MAKGDGSVVRILLGYQDMAVEAAHFRDAEHADAAERVGLGVQDFAFGNVGLKLCVRAGLQSEEGDFAGGDIAFQCSASKVRIASFWLKQAVLDQLVFYSRLASLVQAAEGSVSAVEAHERVCELVGILCLSLDFVVVQVLRNGVVDVKQGDGSACDACSDVLRKSAKDVDFAGNRNALVGKAAVYVARLKSKCLGEGRPTLVGKDNVVAGALVLFCPVKQGKLKLRHAGQEVGIVVSVGAKLGGHVFDNVGDSLVVLVGLVRYQQVKLRVLFNLYADVVKAFDRGVAGKEVLRARSECDDLKVRKSDKGAGHRNKVLHHGGDFFGCSNRILGKNGLELSEAKVVRAVEDAAVSVAASVNQAAVLV